MAGETHDFRGEIDAEAGKYACYIVIHDEPPIEWGVVVGDVIHNLRSALDHLTWLLVPKPGRATQFPIYDNREDFDCSVRLAAKRKRRGPLTGLDPQSATFAFIEQAQPYRGPHGPEHHPLHALRALSNEDKHRTVLPLAVGIPDDSEHPPQVSIVTARDIELTNLWVQLAKPLKNNAQIMGADAEITGPDPHVEVQIDFPFDIAFGETMITTRGVAPVLETVREIIKQAPQIREKAP